MWRLEKRSRVWWPPLMVIPGWTHVSQLTFWCHFHRQLGWCVSQGIFSDLSVSVECVHVCAFCGLDWNGQMCHRCLLENVRPCLFGLFGTRSVCVCVFKYASDAKWVCVLSYFDRAQGNINPQQHHCPSSSPWRPKVETVQVTKLQ